MGPRPRPLPTLAMLVCRWSQQQVRTCSCLKRTSMTMTRQVLRRYVYGLRQGTFGQNGVAARASSTPPSHSLRYRQFTRRRQIARRQFRRRDSRAAWSLRHKGCRLLWPRGVCMWSVTPATMWLRYCHRKQMQRGGPRAWRLVRDQALQTAGGAAAPGAGAKVLTVAAVVGVKFLTVAVVILVAEVVPIRCRTSSPSSCERAI